MPTKTKDKAAEIKGLSKHFERLQDVLSFAEKLSETKKEKDFEETLRKSPVLKDILKVKS